MADLDEIYLLLGEVRSDVKHVLSWQEEHEERDQERYRNLQDGHDKLGAQIAVTAAFAPRMERIELDIVQSKPVLDMVRKAKWIVIGFAAAVTFVGGTVGGFAATALDWLK